MTKFFMEGNREFNSPQPDNDSQKEQLQQEKESMRKRVEALRETDSPYDDSVYNIAEKEGDYRKVLSRGNIPSVTAEELANLYSNETLEKIEAEKAKWIDDLTGLQNRTAFVHEVKKYLTLEKRTESEVAFLMIDFDHFKRVNDEQGHDAGDVALEKIARIIDRTVRDSDIVYRYGGEEFMVLLPNTDSRSALILAERIRSSVENSDITVTDNEGKEVTLKKTVSIGCVGTDQIADWQDLSKKDMEQLLNKITNFADRAMYTSKICGRNRVTLFDETLVDVAKKK
ncbi:MAG: GGDEF domain-containing protein [Parcubacteria group bacterium]|jgi:diguanylate cyclase (GGDEF)-like protein